MKQKIIEMINDIKKMQDSTAMKCAIRRVMTEIEGTEKIVCEMTEIRYKNKRWSEPTAWISRTEQSYAICAYVSIRTRIYKLYLILDNDDRISIRVTDEKNRKSFETETLAEAIGLRINI